MHSDGFEVVDFNFEADCWCASAGNCNGASGYHREDENSLTAPFIARFAVEFPTIIIGGKDRIRYIPGYYRLTLDYEIEEKGSQGALEELKNFYRDYPCVTVLTGGTGARCRSKSLSKYIIENRLGPLVRSESIDCVPATIFNVLKVFLGNEQAKSAIEKLQDSNFHFVTLKRAGQVLRGLRMQLNFRESSKGSLVHAQCFDGAFDMIGKLIPDSVLEALNGS